MAADILSKEEILSGNEELANQVVVHLLPLMVIDSDDLESAETKFAVYLSKSGICSLHPVLRGWKAGEKKMNRKHFKKKINTIKNWLYLFFEIILIVCVSKIKFVFAEIEYIQ